MSRSRNVREMFQVFNRKIVLKLGSRMIVFASLAVTKLTLTNRNLKKKFNMRKIRPGDKNCANSRAPKNELSWSRKELLITLDIFSIRCGTRKDCLECPLSYFCTQI